MSLLKKKAAGRIGSVAALAALMSLVLSGCSMETTSPSQARDHADKKSAAPFGPVDCRKAKCIALTFDAGPGPNTSHLLDVLKEKKVHATFFLLGRDHVMKYPELVKREAAEGHEVGNHTWTHKILTKEKGDVAREEIEKTEVAVEKITGTRPRVMRPPQGRTNDDVSKICKELGVSQVLWSTTAKDYSTNDSALIEKRTLKQAKPDGIILLHDIYKGTVPAVSGIIDTLKERGYTFVTVPQLLAPAQLKPGQIIRP
ncbi:polysaccharide deacetylase family protein [Streptomyces sp. NBC_01387]|uniref:polysaccharide deacetylase family protein n=1 Tax=unclassified Streptomyces TaxID=2593676 RepID=UPI002024A018|nr:MULTISPECIES: polysaccharide deacetylase family protein [unclassified Streptomyces]MCX4554173.1 polysaccharide deacetylase family protein [Streptomyces sp. NBC_01500]WSC19018.1 polysaccharide deacetylase family protein [Streptomyces sp. NBC_01766]WSV53041.1 polysaccharide deacetylase family protein [Streptomyces sp. NBC_01014]